MSCDMNDIVISNYFFYYFDNYTSQNCIKYLLFYHYYAINQYQGASDSNCSKEEFITSILRFQYVAKLVVLCRTLFIMPFNEKKTHCK